MGKVEKFYHLLEVTVEVIYADGDIKTEAELREFNSHWRWFVCGAWLSAEAWMFADPDVGSVGMPEDWRNYESKMERPTGDSFPLS